jgi:anti-repressor protein
MDNPVPARFEFSFENIAVRVLEINGAPFWVLVDVCVVLGIANPRDAAGRLDDDEKGVGITDTLGGPQEMTIVNESGLWSLVLTSRKPSAKRFKKWITSEVIPAIRKTGSYGAPQLDLNDPAQLRALLLSYSAEVETAKKALTVAQTEASTSKNALDRIAGTGSTFTVTQAAKDLQIRRSHLLDYMRRNRWLYRPRGCADDLPYQDRIESGYLTLKVEVLPRDDGSEKVVQRARITAKGLTKLAQVVPGARHIGGNDAR